MNYMSKPVFPILLIPTTVKNRESFLPINPPTGTGMAPIGASEKLFEDALVRSFGDWVKPQQIMLPPGHDLHYTADFLIIEPITGLHFDVEVDEPISFSTGGATHFVGDDDYRNKCFVDANWVVIRFAEEQVSSQPMRCCRFIANVIAGCTGNNMLSEKFNNIPRLDKVQQWTKGQALKLKKSQYRQSYLGVRK
ncbi:MAG: hypothetical protein HC815_05960 [Richelia sp. RM1_1_1]|nr:hypothetical protein [Richelia sp. RM1_1_1]